MSNKCLVTRLSGVVDNPALEYFDALQFMVDLSEVPGNNILILNGSGDMMRLGGPGAKLIVLSNGEIRVAGSTPGSGSTEYTIPIDWSGEGGMCLYAIDATKPVEFLIVGLDKIEQLALNYPSQTKIELRDPQKLVYCVNLESFDRSGAIEVPIFRPYPENDKCDISNYLFNFKDKADVTSIRFYNRINTANFCLTGSQAFVGYDSLQVINRNAAVDYGRLSDFSELTELTSIGLGLTGSQRGVEGDLTSLAKLTKLTTINMNNTKVTGSLEDFAAAQYAEGRLTASRIQVYGPYLTYDDDGETKYVGSAGVYLSWADGGEAPVLTVELS